MQAIISQEGKGVQLATPDRQTSPHCVYFFFLLAGERVRSPKVPFPERPLFRPRPSCVSKKQRLILRNRPYQNAGSHEHNWKNVQAEKTEGRTYALTIVNAVRYPTGMGCSPAIWQGEKGRVECAVCEYRRPRNALEIYTAGHQPVEEKTGVS